MSRMIVDQSKSISKNKSFALFVHQMRVIYIDRTDQRGTRPSLFHLLMLSEKVEGVTPRLFTTAARWNNDWPSTPAVCFVFIIH